MASPRWDDVQDIFHRALELPPSARAGFLDSATADEDTRRSVLRLLEAAEASTSFLMTSVSSGLAREKLPEGTRIGAWRIGERLGAGGMGEVYKAFRDDGHYDQTAAMKLIATEREDAAERFARERAILARLEHPNIARLIDGGVAPDGRPFMTIEYVEGIEIDRWAEARSLGLRDRLQLLLQVCAALSHAHARLVLHRDVKPSNVLVTQQGRVRLIDFGVAAQLSGEDDADLVAPLTPAYSAPEQFNGETVSVATDVFALGGLLCALIGGEPPQRNVDRTIAALPARIGRQRDLAAIAQKALQSSPEDRYPTVESFAEDIRSYLAMRPVTARQGGALYRFGQFARRNWIGVGLTAALALALIGGLTTSLIFAAEADREADRATEALARTERALADAERTARLRQALTESLQTLFVASEDEAGLKPELLRDGLIRHAERNLPELETAAESASYTLSAIGGYFSDRGDPAATVAVLEPWTNFDGTPTRLKVERDIALAKAYMSLGRKDEAVPLYDRAIETSLQTDPDYELSVAHASHSSGRALVLDEAESHREALDILRAALQRDEQETGGQYAPHLYNEIGNQLDELSDYDAAIEAYNEGIRRQIALDPSRVIDLDTNYLNVAGVALYAADDDEAAETALNEVMRIARDLKGGSGLLAEAHVGMTQVYLMRKEDETALEMLEKADALLSTYHQDVPLRQRQTGLARVRVMSALGRSEESADLLMEIGGLETLSGIEETEDVMTAIAASFHFAGAGETDQAEAMLARFLTLIGDETTLSRRGQFLLRRMRERIEASREP